MAYLILTLDDNDAVKSLSSYATLDQLNKRMSLLLDNKVKNNVTTWERKKDISIEWTSNVELLERNHTDGIRTNYPVEIDLYGEKESGDTYLEVVINSFGELVMITGFGSQDDILKHIKKVKTTDWIDTFSEDDEGRFESFSFKGSCLTKRYDTSNSAFHVFIKVEDGISPVEQLRAIS